MNMFLKPIIRLIYTGYSKLRGTVDFPATLDIELTNNCNLNCVMCSRSLMSRKIGSLDISLLKKIIEEIKFYPLRSIGLHLFGEPLMHDNLIQMIKLIKENIGDTKLVLSTNAYFLSQGISKDIIASGLDIIRFSLDGTDQSVYEKLRRGSNFDRVINNIKKFISIRDLANTDCPIIQMQIISMKDTVKQISSFKKFWKPLLKKNDQIIIQNFITFAGKIADRTRFKIASLRDRFKRRLPCLRLWKNLVVYWDGRVGVCCYDYDGELLVGDINKETIKQIWNGEKINLMRLGQLSKDKTKFSLCRSCISQGS